MFGLFRRKQKAPAGRKMTSADLAELLRCDPLSSAGPAVTPERAMRVATVYACVRVLAESVAQLPCKIYRRDETGREQVESGPLFDLMHFPNPWQNSFEFREYLMACLCLRGNFFALKSKRRGEVIELLPLRPEAVSVRRRNWEPLYTYTDVEGHTGVVGADKMLHVRGLSLDGIMGVSPIRYGRDAIGLAMATEKHGALMFRNGARPGGVLKHPAKLSDEALEHLKISWEAAHGGENSGRTAILEEGMSYESVSMTNEDAQYLDTRQFQRNEICALFRVPPHMVGDLTKSSFSNITQQSLEFVKYSVLPWCRRIETAFWHGLLSDEQRREGYRVEFLVDGLERADIKTRYESYSIAIQNGILSPNECRRLENRNPRDGGDVFLQPLNMTDGRQAGEPAREEEKAASPGGPMAPDAGAAQAEGTRSGVPGDASLAHMAAIVGAMEAQAFQHQDKIDRIMAAGKAQAAKESNADDEKAAVPTACHAEKRSDETSPANRQEILRACGPQNDSLVATKAAADEDEDDEPEHDDWASGEWNEESADLNQIMRDFRPALERMYRAIVAKEAAEIRKLVDKYFPETGEKRAKSAETEFMDALQLFYGQLRPELGHTCRRLYADLSGIVAAMTAKQLGIDEQKLLKQLRSTVKDYADIEAADYVESSLRQLQKLVDQKENVRAVLQRRIAEWEAKRGVKVSKAAAVYGPNWYAREAYKRAGVKKIRWVANGSKTCSFCRGLNGKVVGIKEHFVGKDGTMPGRNGTQHAFKKAKFQPPIHRGCVCAIVPVVDAVVPEEMRASVEQCAKAADLLAEGDVEQAKKIGGNALENLVNASGLLKEGYKIKTVGFSPEKAGAYMDVNVVEGEINLNDKSFLVDVVGLAGQTVKHEWIPARGVLNALKKIHDGRLLTFMDEAALAGFYHEIQHTRQVFEIPPEKHTGPQRRLLETINEWTARRNYHELLKKLGRESIIQGKEMKEKKFGYSRRVANFDALLKRLEIKDEDLLDKLTKINNTEQTDLFDESISKLLSEMTKIEGVQIKKALQNINDKNFKDYLK